MVQLIHELYPELMHYTTALGLHGIITSGTLRATNYEFLNDLQEYRLFSDFRFPLLVRQAVKRAVEEAPVGGSFFKRVQSFADLEEYVEGVSEELEGLLVPRLLEFETPYVAFFCAAKPEENFIARNGLLSQWRGYGPDGGYAIVFDTERLSELVIRQRGHIEGMHFFGGNVEYYNEPAMDAPIYSETVENSELVVAAIAKFLHSKLPEDMAEILEPVVKLAVLTKHGGFREEREVMYAICQPHPNAVKAYPEDHKLLPVQHVARGGTPVPYVALFCFPELSRGQLPITRVIVGPHRESATRKRAVQLLLEQNGYNATVEISGTAYRGP